MADAYTSGGGGGISGTVTENTRYGLDKPYDFDGSWGPDQIGQLNEMLTYLFRGVRKGEDNHLDLTDTVNAIESDLLLVTRSLTHSEILTLNSVPVTLVAAPGANKVIYPVRWSLKKVTTTAYNVGGTFNLRYAGIATDLMNGASMFLGDANDTRYITTLLGAVTHTTNIPNTALQIRAATDFTLGTSTNFVDVHVVYYIGTVTSA